MNALDDAGVDSVDYVRWCETFGEDPNNEDTQYEFLALVEG